MGRPTRGELEAENARLTAEVAGLRGELVERDERLARLEKLVEELRRRGKRQSAPFSKGDPVLAPARSGRKSGEVHGRHGHRPVPPTVDRDLDAPLPECCPGCGGDVEFERWAEQFQTELPDPAPVVTRFRVGVGRCRSCRRRVQGRHPEQTSDALGAAAAHIGPRARGLGHWLHYVLGLSFAKSARLLGHLGVPVTAGALSSGAQSTGMALVPTTKAIEKAAAASDMVVMDETGWRVCGWGAWLWVATTRNHTVYKVRHGRGFDQACDLIPKEYTGTIVRDGWAPYRRYTKATHQPCTAHLLRRCVEMIEADTPGGRAMPRQVKTLLHEALTARDLPEDAKAEEAERIGARFDEIIAGPHGCDPDRRLAKHLGNERHALLSFLTIGGIDATNWRGEQAIRPAVVNRKVWGGNRTDFGAGTQERMMTFFQTAAQQGADAIDLLVQLARAPDRHTLTGLIIPNT